MVGRVDVLVDVQPESVGEAVFQSVRGVPGIVHVGRSELKVSGAIHERPARRAQVGQQVRGDERDAGVEEPVDRALRDVAAVAAADDDHARAQRLSTFDDQLCDVVGVPDVLGGVGDDHV
ncbi:hypothetical protein Prum_015440 [Phytohabitans rumicis]|uniref:Uncharacterized protein n=1 Tax=Phytohabitans rumicis TaxID=1076125 RepID=A0A6V8KRZ0_9ACTN|nr:hypothetical protein Prum_015440 [Phytohabitans rumicis]